MKSEQFLEIQVWMTCMPPFSLMSLSNTTKSVPREKAELMRVILFLVPAQLMRGFLISGGIFSVILQMLVENWLSSGELATMLSFSSVQKKTRMGLCSFLTSRMRLRRWLMKSTFSQTLGGIISLLDSPQMEGRQQMSPILQSSLMIFFLNSDMASTVPDTPIMWLKYLGSSAYENCPMMRLMLVFLLQFSSLILPRSYSQKEAKAVLQPKLSLSLTESLSTYCISWFLISQGWMLQFLQAWSMDSTWFFSSSFRCGYKASKLAYCSLWNVIRFSCPSLRCSQMNLISIFTSGLSTATPGVYSCPKYFSSKKTSTSSMTRILLFSPSWLSRRLSFSRYASWSAVSFSLRSTFLVTSLKLCLLDSLKRDQQCSEKAPQVMVSLTPKRTKREWNSSSSLLDRQEEQQPQQTSQPLRARQQLSPPSTRDLPSPVLTSISLLSSLAYCMCWALTRSRIATTCAACGLPSKFISSWCESMFRQIAYTAKILAIIIEGVSSLASAFVYFISCRMRVSDLVSSKSFSTLMSYFWYSSKARTSFLESSGLLAVWGDLLSTLWMSFMSLVFFWNCSSLTPLKMFMELAPMMMSLFLDFLTQLRKAAFRFLSYLSISSCTLLKICRHSSSISESKFASIFFRVTKCSKIFWMIFSDLALNLLRRYSTLTASVLSSISFSALDWLERVLISPSIFCWRASSLSISWKESLTSLMSRSYFILILLLSVSMCIFFFSSIFLTVKVKVSYSFSRLWTWCSSLSSICMSSSMTIFLKSYSSLMISLQLRRLSLRTMSCSCRIILYLSTISILLLWNISEISFFMTAYSLIQDISTTRTTSLQFMDFRFSSSRQLFLRQCSNLQSLYLTSLKTSTMCSTFLRCSKRKWRLSYCSLNSSLQNRNCLISSQTFSILMLMRLTISSYSPRTLKQFSNGCRWCIRRISLEQISIFISCRNSRFRLHPSSNSFSCSRFLHSVSQLEVMSCLMLQISWCSRCLSRSSSSDFSSCSMQIAQSLTRFMSDSQAFWMRGSLQPSDFSMRVTLCLTERSSGRQKQILYSLLLKMSLMAGVVRGSLSLQRLLRKWVFLSVSLEMLSQEQFMYSSRILRYSLQNLWFFSCFLHSSRNTSRFSKSSSFSLRFSLLISFCRSSITLFLWMVISSRQQAISLFSSLFSFCISARSEPLLISPYSHSFPYSSFIDCSTDLYNFPCSLLTLVFGTYFTMFVQKSKCSSFSGYSGLFVIQASTYER